MNDLFLFAVFTRSLDNYHNRYNLTHLISSVFYFDSLDLNFSNLVKIDKSKYSYIMVVNPLNLNMLESICQENLELENLKVDGPIVKLTENKLIIFEINMLWLLITYIDSDFYSENKFEDFLLEVFNNLVPVNDKLTKENILNNILFIFKNTEWLILQLLFKSMKIILSGGSISKRHYLSTSEFSLSKFLLLLGLLDNSIYKSYMLHKNATDISSDFTNIKIPIILFKLLISLKKQFIINKMLLSINLLEKEISDNNNNIKSLESQSKIKLAKKSKTNLSMSNVELNEKTDKLIENLKHAIIKKGSEILVIKSQISELEQNILKLFKGSYDEIKNVYIKYFHNEVGDIGSKKRIKLFNKKISIHTSNLSSKPGVNVTSLPHSLDRREYSTLNVRSMQSKKLEGGNITDYPSPLIINNSSISLIWCNRRYKSIYSNNPIISDNLMKILYSDNSKENIQKNIENYLISQQNKLLLKDFEDVILNYKILNPKIVNALIESKLKIEKLYLNINLHLKNLDKIEDQYFSLNLLSKIELDDIINIIFGKVLLIISNNNIYNKFTHFTEVSYDLGKEIVNKYNYQLYLLHRNKDKNCTFSEFILENSSIIKSDDPTKMVELGSILIGWLLEIKLLSKKIVFLGKNDKRNILLAGEKINNYLNKTDNKEIINLPVKLPMICKPKKYLNDDDSISLGGFLLNDVVYVESLIIDKTHLAHKSSFSKGNIIYKLVDNINSVPFAINQEVLDFITKHYKTFNLIIDPEYSHPLESKEKLTLIERKELESFTSKRNLEFEILNIAQIFRNSTELYIPIRLDYRGRIYCNVEYLHYQSVELAKSLLQFAKGEVVYLNDEVSINFLKIFGANCYGNRLDKISFIDRINWIDKNKNNIIKFENGKLFSKAENKLLFIAFCFEYNKYLDAVNKNQESFITHLPIQLDASCNGFQHLSLLLEDTTLAKQVNLSSSTWKNVPDDFYTFLSLKIKDYLKFELKHNKDLDLVRKESYKRLSQLEFQNHRSLVKKTIMTIPYNSTKYTNILDMKEDFKLINKNGESIYIYKKDNKIIFKNIDFQVICNTLYLCLYRDFPKLEGLLNYFKTIAKISNKLGISIPWNLPTGLNVRQKFYGTKKIKFKPFIYSKDLLNLNIVDKNITNSRKQIRSLMPNLVHSLDAASLSLLIINFFKEENKNNFYSIHDCFAVTCNNVNLIYELLKLSYYKIYSTESFLLTFDKNFKESILTQFGENAYSNETNKITVINDEGEKLILQYPNINEVFKPENLDFMNSSYFIG